MSLCATYSESDCRCRTSPDTISIITGIGKKRIIATVASITGAEFKLYFDDVIAG